MIEQQHAYTEREAARYLGVSAAAMRLWRSEGRGPRHFKAGEKLIRYRKSDLDSWIEERLSKPRTSEALAEAMSTAVTQRAISGAS